MEEKSTNRLQIKVFIGLGLLLLGTASIVAYLNLLNTQNNANQELRSYVQQLQKLIIRTPRVRFHITVT